VLGHSLSDSNEPGVTGIGNWYNRLDAVIAEDLRVRRTYNGKSISDLLRAIRNKKSHYLELPPWVRKTYGAMPVGFAHYWFSRFPQLFLHTYHAMHWVKSEPTFTKYYHRDFDFLEVDYARQKGESGRSEAKKISPEAFRVHSEWASGDQRKLFMIFDNHKSGEGEPTSAQSSVISNWENRSVVSTDLDSPRIQEVMEEEADQAAGKTPSGNFHDMSKPLPPPLTTITPAAAAPPPPMPNTHHFEASATLTTTPSSSPMGQELLNNQVSAMIKPPASPAVRRSVVQLNTKQASELSLRPSAAAMWSDVAAGRQENEVTAGLPSNGPLREPDATTGVSNGNKVNGGDTNDEEFSSEYSNHSERDPTEAFDDQDDGFAICQSSNGTPPSVIPAVLPATSSVSQPPSNNITATLKKSCDKENCEPSDGVTTLTDGTAANPELQQHSDFFLNEDVASDVAAVNNGAPVWIISPDEDKPKKKKNKKKKRVEKDA